MTDPIRVAVVCDYLEERWPSMDLVAEMVLEHLAARPPGEVLARRIRPEWTPRVARVPGLGAGGAARNADRVLNRYVDYPSYLRKAVKADDRELFHLVDHSYSQLVPALPGGRSVVTCHDLDTFRCLLDPAAEPRPRWFRALARKTLSGLQSAAAVACDSEATRSAILRHGLIPEDRLRVVYLAVHPECSPEPSEEFDRLASGLLGPADPDGPPVILHVGSNIPRKRADVLLKVFAGIRRARPGARLVKVGARFEGELHALAESLGVLGSVTTIPYFDPKISSERATLAAVYRRASLALQTSDAEGFGLPVAEAQACGVPVLASDLPVLREVGGPSAVSRPVGEVSSWVEAALDLLDEPHRRPDAHRLRRDEGVARALLFSWPTHVEILMQMYRDVLLGVPVARREPSPPIAAT